MDPAMATVEVAALLPMEASPGLLVRNLIKVTMIGIYNK